MQEVVVEKVIHLAESRGFCGGVRNALNLFDRTAKLCAGEPIYVLHELVHNHRVNAELIERGAVLVDSVEAIPGGATALFGAHGVSREVERRARERKLKLYDATCPLVRKLQTLASELAPEDELVIFGKEDHPEVQGVIGHSGTRNVYLVSGVEDVEKLPPLFRPVLLSQTTRNRHEIAAVADALRRRFPGVRDHAGVCDAVNQRQQAVEKLAGFCDLVLVVGSGHSSNARRLVEIAAAAGIPAHLVDSAEDLGNVPELENAHSLGISAGASTPETLVDEVIGVLRRRGWNTEK